VLAAVVVLVGPPRVVLGGIDQNERQTIDDLVLFAALEDEMIGVAFGRVPIETLANPRAAIPMLRDSDLPLRVEPRFLTHERHGYRFHFEGTPRDKAFPMPVREGFEEVTYVATPIEPGKTGRRTFAYYSRLGHTIFSRTDGRLPTPDDTVAHTWPW